MVIVMNKQVKNMVSKIDRRSLRNNTQRVLLALLTNDQEWVSRTSIRVPNAPARIRELRSKDFGSFRVTCASATTLKRRNTSDTRQTYYRIDRASVTKKQIARVFDVEGVVSAR
jgi:hypothetical protein